MVGKDGRGTAGASERMHRHYCAPREDTGEPFIGREGIMREVMKAVMENAERHALRRLGVPDGEECELAQRALKFEEAELRDEEVHFTRKDGRKKGCFQIYGLGKDDMELEE